MCAFVCIYLCLTFNTPVRFLFYFEVTAIPPLRVVLGVLPTFTFESTQVCMRVLPAQVGVPNPIITSHCSLLQIIADTVSAFL